MVGDSYAMGVASQIVQHVFGSAERWFGINDPILFTQGVQKCAEGFFFGQRQALPVERQLLGAESTPQPSHEFSAEDATEDQDRQEEVDGCGDPVLVIGRQASAGHHTMNVRMRLQGLSPGMQDAEEADLRTEMFGIGGQFQQGGCGGLEQESEQNFFVLPHQWNQGVRHAEDQMKIVHRQQLLLTFSEPLLTGMGLAFRTMPVPAGVVGYAGAISAMGTVIEMAA